MSDLLGELWGGALALSSVALLMGLLTLERNGRWPASLAWWIGAAMVPALVVGGATRLAMVKTGSSYLSQSELPLTFGLGAASKVEQVEIRWPSGQVDRLGPQAAGQTLIVTEAKGVTTRVPFAR